MKLTEEEITALDSDIKMCVEEACKNYPLHRPEDKKVIEKAIRAFLSGSEPLYKSLGITEELMEKYYALAYNLYNQGRYLDALAVFKNIFPKDGLNPRYAFGVAACYHQLKDYENAAVFYQMTTMLDLIDPIPAYHLYDCVIRMNNPLYATYALEMVMKRCKNDPMYQKLYEAAKLHLDSADAALRAQKSK
jgi:type III secretion system low calcium response chaperone LcrH/SycD